MGKLNTFTVQRAIKPGLIGDGNGLYLQVSVGGSKSWIFRFTLHKRPRMMGLGSCDLLTLAEARMKANDCRKLLLDGKDPIESRINDDAQKRQQAIRSITFDDCALKYIESHRASWRNVKHGDQWTNTLKTYASPVIGNLPIQMVNTSMVMQILEPIWSTKNETASRVRSRIELILAWAKVRGYRDGENPALWRNHLDKLLPARSRIAKVKHFAALSFEDISKFNRELRSNHGVSFRALEFLILTATRTSETLLATWKEFNFDESLWIIPGNRMKAGVEHRVPLSAPAVKILLEMQSISESEYVFPGGRRGRPLSNVALLKVIQKLGYEITGHGFRSTFRDWASERTNYPREVCEQALAHSIQDKVESAYRRGDLLLKRRALMNDWASYCAQNLPRTDVFHMESRSTAL